jgi:hypothetical protein
MIACVKKKSGIMARKACRLLKWHGSNSLAVPANITLVPLPSYSPELNPVERVSLYLKERFLSHRRLSATMPSSRLPDHPEQAGGQGSYPWIPEVNA